jgi:hypothetical protein
MPTPATSPAQEPELITGPLGDGGLHPGKYNMKMAAKAIKEGWPITPAMKQLLINQMILVVGKSPNNRDKTAAARVIISADAINARREQTAQEAETGGNTFNLNVAKVENPVVSLRQELLNDPEYLEFLRSRSEDGESGAVREVHLSGPVEDAQPPEGAGPGHHGNTPGSGGDPPPDCDHAPPAR